MTTFLKAKFVFSFFAIFFLFTPLFTSFAQIRDSDVLVEIVPEIPGPNESVTVNLTSYSMNLDKAKISWGINGKNNISITGKKSFTFTTGDIGTASTVTVSILVDNLTRIDKKLVIYPAEVDMLWESTDSYVPAFYKGKALPSSESQIKVVAMPNILTPAGTKAKTSDLTFNWKRNYKVVQGGSGYAKDSFSFKTSYLNAGENVSVEVSTISSNYGGKGSVSLATGKPKILFYEDNPLEGENLAKALNAGFSLKGTEAALVAEPYFFSPKYNLSNELTYSWSINDRAIDTPPQKNRLVLRSIPNQTGQARVGLSLESVSKLFQTAKESFLINLNK